MAGHQRQSKTRRAHSQFSAWNKTRQLPVFVGLLLSFCPQPPQPDAYSLADKTALPLGSYSDLHSTLHCTEMHVPAEYKFGAAMGLLQWVCFMHEFSLIFNSLMHGSQYSTLVSKVRSYQLQREDRRKAIKYPLVLARDWGWLVRLTQCKPFGKLVQHYSLEGVSSTLCPLCQALAAVLPRSSPPLPF